MTDDHNNSNRPSEQAETGAPSDPDETPELVPVGKTLPDRTLDKPLTDHPLVETSYTLKMHEPNPEKLESKRAVRDWEYKIDTPFGETYIGQNAKKELIDAHKKDGFEDEPLWFGWAETSHQAIREIGVPAHSWNEHFSIFGTTGKGKSTVMMNMLVQVANKGYGFCFQDPEGDTIRELLTMIPEHRRDDVIYIEPASPQYDNVVGLNFFEPGSYESETEYNREVESIVEDLIAVLKDEGYWGARMERITKNIARAMVRSERNYTLVDMYHVLVDQQSRELFAQAVAQEGMGEIQNYTRQIAEMDDEDIDPVLGRIQGWVEDPNARSIVAHRESSVNLAEAINGDKIILVNLDVGYSDLQRVVGTAIMRRIWSEINKRSKMDRADYNPFFTVFDEFHELVSEDMDLQEMLATARKAKMPIMLATQNPGADQVPPNILEQIKANTDTMLCLGLRNPTHAAELAQRFGDDITKRVLTDLPKYEVITQLTVMDEGKAVRTDPIHATIFPPTWPVRTMEEARALVEESLDRHGVPPRQKELDETELILKQSAGDNYLETSFLEAVWAEQLRNGGGAVTVRDVMDGFETRTGRRLGDLPDGMSIDADLISVDRPGSDTTHTIEKGSNSERQQEPIRQHETAVQVTEAGKAAVLEQDGDRAPPSDAHRMILRRGFENFSTLGMDVSITKQVSEHGDNDATGYRPVELDVDPTEIENALQAYRDQCPRLTELTNCKEVSFEAEHSGISKPAHPIENLRRAFANNQLALFLVANGTNSGVPPTKFSERLKSIFTDNKFVRDTRFILPGKDRDDPDNHREQAVRLLYNKSEPLQLGKPSDDQQKYALLPKGEQSTWVDTGDGTLLLYGGRGEDAKQRGQIHRGEVNYASTNPFQFWTRYDRHNDEWVVYPDNGPEKRYETQEELQDDWTRVYRPLLPEVEFASREQLANGVPDEVDYPEMDTDWGILRVDIADLMDDAHSEGAADAAQAIGAADSSTEAMAEDSSQESAHDDEARAEPADTRMRASMLAGIQTDDGIEPVIPPELWDEKNVVDDVTGNPDTDTPEYVLEAVIEYHGSAEAAGLTSPASERTSDGATTRTDGSSSPSNSSPDGVDSGESREVSGDASTAVVGDSEGGDSVSVQPADPLASPAVGSPPEDLVAMFGVKEPETVWFWRALWADLGIPDEQPLTERQLEGAVQKSLGMRQDQAEAAITIGTTTAVLLSSDHEGETYYAPALPSRAPGRYLETPERYANPADWKAIWDARGADRTDGIESKILAIHVYDETEGCTKAEAVAIVAAAAYQGALTVGEGGKYYLGDQRYPQQWLAIWEDLDKDPDEEGIPEVDFVPVMSWVFEDRTDAERKQLLSEAREKGIIYEQDGKLYLNDPRTAEGPEIRGDLTAQAAIESTNATSESSTEAGDNDDEGGVEMSVDEGVTDVMGSDADFSEAPDQEESSGDSDPEGASASEGSEASAADGNADDDDQSGEAADAGDSASGGDESSSLDDGAGGGERVADEGGADGEQAGSGSPTGGSAQDATDDRQGGAQEAASDDSEPTDGPGQSSTGDDESSTSDDDAQSPQAEGGSPSEDSASSPDAASDSELPVADDSGSDSSSNPETVTLPEEVQEAFLTSIKAYQWALKSPLSYRWQPSTAGDGDGPGAVVNDASPWPSDRYSERVQWPETAREYFEAPSHDPLEAVPVDDAGDVDIAAAMPDDVEDPPSDGRMLPEEFETRYSRGWSSETVEAKELGYAPPRQILDIVQALSFFGFDRETILKTGLCTETSDASEETDYPTPSEQQREEWDEITDCPITAEDLDLEPQFEARFVFPYFNENGEPVYAVSRRVGDGHENDGMDQAKYTKLAKTEEAVVDEPIYGRETIRDGEGLVITEGIADAISAHELGIPCISPVTVNFRQKHWEILADIIEAHDIPAVYFIQDAGPVSASTKNSSRAHKLPLDIKKQIGLEHWVRDATDGAEIATEATTGGRLNRRDLDRVNLTPEDLPDEEGLPEVVPWDVPLASVSDEFATEETPAPSTDEVDRAVLDAVESTQTDGDGDDADDKAWSAIRRAREETSAATPSFSQRGPIGAGLSIDEYGPGISGAVNTACGLYFELNDVEKPPTSASLLFAGWASTTSSASTDSERSDGAESAGPQPAARATPEIDTDVHIVELPTFGGEKTDLDDFLLENWLPYCQIADWSSRYWWQSRSDDPDVQVWSWLEELAEQGYLTMPGTSDETESSEVLGQVGSISPPWQHPVYFDHEVAATIESVNQAAREEAFAAQSESTNGDTSESSGLELYSMTLHDVGVPIQRSGRSGELYRGANPLGHTGDSRDYFVVYSVDFAYDFKRNASFTPLTYVLVEAGVRSVKSPESGLSDSELFAAWKYAKEKGYISDDAAVPRRGLNWVAVDKGFCEAEEIEEQTFTTDDGEYTVRSLPTEVYNRTLEFIEEEFGLDPGRPKNTASTSTDSSTAPPASAFELTFAGTTEDPFSLFFDEYIEEPPSSREGSIYTKTLQRMYNEWAAINELEAKSPTAFGMSFSDTTHVSNKKTTGVPEPRPTEYRGIQLSAAGNRLLAYLSDKLGFQLPVDEDDLSGEQAEFLRGDEDRIYVDDVS